MTQNEYLRIKYSATVRRTVLSRDRLLDQLPITLPTVLEVVPMPRPQYWMPRTGPNDMIVSLPAAPPANALRAWSLLSGPIKWSYPAMTDMQDRLQAVAEEDVEEDEDRTVVEEWDAVEVQLAKEKVHQHINANFGSFMPARHDSGHASVDCAIAPTEHETAELNPTGPKASSIQTLPQPGATSSATSTERTVQPKKRGFFAKLCKSVSRTMPTSSAPIAPVGDLKPKQPKLDQLRAAQPSDIVRETCAFVSKYASPATTFLGKRQGNEAGIRSGVMGLLVDATESFLTDKRCADWCNSFSRNGRSLVVRPSKQFRATHATKAQTPHMLIPYVLGGLLRWMAETFIDAGQVIAAPGPSIDELLRVIAGTDVKLLADLRAVVGMLKAPSGSLWVVGSADVRATLATYFVFGVGCGNVAEGAAAVLEGVFAS